MPTRAAVALVTLGCPKNEADSARLATVLARRFRVVADPEHADAVVVNTCGFIEAATEESLAVLLEAAELPRRPLVVAAGCLASRYGDQLAKALPEAGLVVGLERLADLDLLVENALTGCAGRDALERNVGGGLWAVQPSMSGPTAYLTVSDGCDRGCSYCTIPRIRGPYRSREPLDVLAEATGLVERGARELVVVGQDVGAYGKDLAGAAEGRRLPELLSELGRLTEGKAWVRLLYLQPDAVDDALLEAMAGSRSVVPYFDVPIQHADAAVLRAMRRTGGEARFAHMAARIRGRVPDAVLRTTVISGFPGETRQAHEALLRFVQEGHFDYVGVFAYSREEGTRAAILPHAVRRDVRERRRAAVQAAAQGVAHERLCALVGRTVEVLVEGPSDDPDHEWMGRYGGQAPDVDGVVYWSGRSRTPFVPVRIDSVQGLDLVGVARE